MAHPIFDAFAFPWVRRDVQDLHAALFSNITDVGRIDLIYRKCVVPALPLTPGQGADLVWREVLERAFAARRLRELCDLVLQELQGPVLKPLVDAVVNAQFSLDEALLSTDTVFVDRRNLKLELRKLIGPAASHVVLLVRGDPGSGKTWTQRLISDLARECGARSIFLFEGLVSTANDVLDSLFATLKGSARKPELLTTEDAWFRLACTRLQELAEERNEVFWIIVDDLGETRDGPRLDKSVRAFFEHFALALGNPAFAQWFRLVLIDYPDGPVPTKWKPLWIAHRVSESEVNDEAIAEFVMAWALRRKQKQLTKAQADALAADVISRIAPPPPPDPAAPGGAKPPGRLQQIHDALSAALNEL